MFAGLKQNHKVVRDKLSSIKLSDIYRYQMDIIEQATTKKL